MNFNNYMVLLENYNFTFIRSTADTDTTKKIYTSYLKNKIIDKDLIEYFKINGHETFYLEDTNLYLYDIISKNDYSVIDLS